jgi:four helix bundle protein
MKNYRELIVWQKSIDLVVDIYKYTEDFPSNEQYALTSQLRRCVVSIPSNIAEGHGRRSTNDYIRFLNIAHASLCE